MTSSSNRPEIDHLETPPELRDVASLADRLGAQERASATLGLEDRVFRSTHPLLGDAPRPIPFPVAERRTASTNLWRIAAAVAMTGALGLTIVGWRAMNSGAPGASPTGSVAVSGPTRVKVDVAALEADLDRFFASTAPWTGGASTELASLSSDVDSLAGASDPWFGAESGLEEIVNEDSL